MKNYTRIYPIAREIAILITKDWLSTERLSLQEELFRSIDLPTSLTCTKSFSLLAEGLGRYDRDVELEKLFVAQINKFLKFYNFSITLNVKFCKQSLSHYKFWCYCNHLFHRDLPLDINEDKPLLREGFEVLEKHINEETREIEFLVRDKILPCRGKESFKIAGAIFERSSQDISELHFAEHIYKLCNRVCYSEEKFAELYYDLINTRLQFIFKENSDVSYVKVILKKDCEFNGVDIFIAFNEKGE